MNTQTPVELITGSRLRWACRRGMLELDLLLGDFLDKGYDGFTHEEREQFQLLLAYGDQDLFEIFFGSRQPETDELASVIEKIRHAAAT